MPMSARWVIKTFIHSSYLQQPDMIKVYIRILALTYLASNLPDMHWEVTKLASYTLSGNQGQ